MQRIETRTRLIRKKQKRRECLRNYYKARKNNKLND